MVMTPDRDGFPDPSTVRHRDIPHPPEPDDKRPQEPEPPKPTPDEPKARIVTGIRVVAVTGPE